MPDATLLSAPCVWCGYNGEGFWQSGTHAATCPWHEVGSYTARYDRLVNVVAPPAPQPVLHVVAPLTDYPNVTVSVATPTAALPTSDTEAEGILMEEIAALRRDLEAMPTADDVVRAVYDALCDDETGQVLELAERAIRACFAQGTK